MPESKEVAALKKQLKYDQSRSNRLLHELKVVREELNAIKRAGSSNSKGWYTSYIQHSLMTTELQYSELLDNYEKLNNKYNSEMAKRQYIYPNNPSKIPTDEAQIDHKEVE